MFKNTIHRKTATMILLKIEIKKSAFIRFMWLANTICSSKFYFYTFHSNKVIDAEDVANYLSV